MKKIKNNGSQLICKKNQFIYFYIKINDYN